MEEVENESTFYTKKIPGDDRLCEKVASAATDGTLPYLAEGYVDGQDMVS